MPLPGSLWPGAPYPLGATFDGAGTNFAVYSSVAERVTLCLFNADGLEVQLDLPEATGQVFHGYLPGCRPGRRYGFRVHGPHAPERGHLCDERKLLIDPYARAISGQFSWDAGTLAAPPGSAGHGDSATEMPRSVVVSPFFVWSDDRRPRTPWHKTIIYEAHVKGLTMRHPGVPAALRGTYAGLAHPVIVEHLVSLGVTAIELMPTHHFIHDERLVKLGLRNYWGYNSIGYFAPHAEYSSSGDSGEQVLEFKQMVKSLHEAGIEVLLDVVYNHTGEGGRDGPTACFRGLDNAAYYRVEPGTGNHIDFTGCGNSLNMRNPYVLQLVMDSLRYWVLEMHVDGFRFDLAAALARELHDVDRLSAFFDLIQQDPVISQVKLIAEPWDVGEGGYQVGNFPVLWSEWNGQYRDTVRDFWRGAERTLGEFAARLTGSSDLYAHARRTPHASINFVTCHDGFTLRDLVSYDEKHNEANGEDNRDGESHNRSWNCGAEGPTDDPAILALRRRQQRNFLATLLLSQGVPMILAGDELGRTQAGNNNGYCHDGPLSFVDWSALDTDLREFTRRLIALRRAHPVLSVRRWFEGRSIRGSNLTDIGWFKPDGTAMTEVDWNVAFARALGVFLNGEGIQSPGPRGERITDDSFYVLFNAGFDAIDFVVPPALNHEPWFFTFDTETGFPLQPAPPVNAGDRIRVIAHGIYVLSRPRRS
ncbi:MAG: glycogen debranching protein GlgX [Deltaproteobacteria bacterium]|nr:glycogen debranching protein GlgX [Deltaproteobacteria bacterium]